MQLFATFALGLFALFFFCDAFITPVSRAVPVLRGERIGDVRGNLRDHDDSGGGTSGILILVPQSP